MFEYIIIDHIGVYNSILSIEIVKFMFVDTYIGNKNLKTFKCITVLFVTGEK